MICDRLCRHSEMMWILLFFGLKSFIHICKIWWSKDLFISHL